MAVTTKKTDLLRKHSVGTGVPVHTAVNGDEYKDLDTGAKYAYISGAWVNLSAGASATSLVYVDSVQGVDATGNGSMSKPYLTPEYALSDISNTGTITGDTNTSVTLTNISDADNDLLEVGMYVTGTGIDYNTIITAKGNEGADANTVTLSKATTSSTVAGTITFTKFYTLVMNGDFTITGNLYKQGFDYDFGNSNIYFTGLVFSKTTKSYLRFSTTGGHWFGKSSTSRLFSTTAGDNTVTISIKLNSYYAEGTDYNIDFNENGVYKCKHIIVECNDFRAQFGRIANTESHIYTSGGTITFKGNFYGLLEGIRTRYGFFNLIGNVETPASVNALYFLSSSCAINGSIRGSVFNFMRGTLNGEVIGTSFLVASGSYSTPAIINASLNCSTVTINLNCFAIFNGQILGSVINSGADVTINNMIGNYTGSGTGICSIKGSSDVGLTLGTVTLNDTHFVTLINNRSSTGSNLILNAGTKLVNKGYWQTRITTLAGTLINEGDLKIYYKTTVTGFFQNNNVIELLNNTTENTSNTPTISISSGTFIQNGGKLYCLVATSKSGIIQKIADTGQLIFKGQPQLKVANGLAPLQILSNTGTAQDVMNFGCITNGAVGFRLADTFTDTTYGTAYAPNILVGGTNYEDTTYDF